MFEYLTAYNLSYHNQSLFNPGDSCINRLLSITYEVYKSLDEVYET